MNTTQWTALITSDMPGRKRYGEIERVVKECLDGAAVVCEFSTKDVVEQLMPIAICRGEQIEARNELFTILMKLAEREVYQNGKKVDLTLKEFELLHYLMRRPGQAANREDLYLHLWDFADNAMSNIIDAHVKNLRRKLDAGEPATTIETVRGVGYRVMP